MGACSWQIYIYLFKTMNCKVSVSDFSQMQHHFLPSTATGTYSVHSSVGMAVFPVRYNIVVYRIALNSDKVRILAAIWPYV